MYIKGLKYLRGCKYFMGLIYGYKDKMYGCMDICIYEYIWIHGYMNIYIYIILACPVYQGKQVSRQF